MLVNGQNRYGQNRGLESVNALISGAFENERREATTS